MDTKKLNDFSKAVYSLFSENYPQWIGLAQIPPGKDYFVVEINSPQGSQYKLIIETCDNEITVHFYYFHSHFGWSDIPARESFPEAKKMIDDIVQDRIAVASHFDKLGESNAALALDTDRIVTFNEDGRWRGSTTVPIADIQQFKKKNLQYNRIIGWSRTYS